MEPTQIALQHMSKVALVNNIICVALVVAVVVAVVLALVIGREERRFRREEGREP